MTKPILFTREGYEKIQQEQKDLLSSRPAAVLDLKKAREMGDLSENGYYKGARAKLSQIDARLRHLAHLLRFGKVQEPGFTDLVEIGVTVVLESLGQELMYTIVGEHEANPSEKKISHMSPLGSQLLHRKIGETITLILPSGQKTYTIRKIGF